MKKPIILVKICYKLLYVIQRILIGNFLASTDIKAFGRTYVGLLLIGLALFYTHGCFSLAYHYFCKYVYHCFMEVYKQVLL